jgi:hypothetical protein
MFLFSPKKTTYPHDSQRNGFPQNRSDRNSGTVSRKHRATEGKKTKKKPLF